MTKFYWECDRVGREILQAIALGLNLEDIDYLTRKHGGHDNQLRLLHYLPVPAEDLESERVSRCAAHTDWSSITMLFQDDCGGLEVEDTSRPGTFIPAAPARNSIIVNVGDLLQRWSNGMILPDVAVQYILIPCRSASFHKSSSWATGAFGPVRRSESDDARAILDSLLHVAR
jgi:isopenicillin N synthase-like dioxygenase